MEYNVLVAEDSPTMRFFVSFGLKQIKNINVLEANDGIQALNTLLKEKVDLVILDVNMPLMGGMDLLAKIRENPKLKEVPVVLATTENNLREKGSQLGATAFLSKPIRVNDLHKIVKEILKIEA
jgi:two-component system, chemotaxis family, chemotaxis protein CheY